MKINVTSPLRYPGSKQKFSKTVETIIKANGLIPNLFVEPFAGGASVSLYLLQKDVVGTIGLIEKDPLVASFWKCVFYDPRWLIDAIANLEITIKEWHRFRDMVPCNTRERALKCIFLNRTNFSGILKAGPIGGKRQKSKYDIACRFKKEDIIRKIEILSTYSDRVAFVDEGDYLDVLLERFSVVNNDTLFYFDPPYVNKAKGLYTYYFDDRDHIELSEYIESIANRTNWLLSYDYDPLIEKLYIKTPNMTTFDITYTATKLSSRIKKRELVASNLDLSCVDAHLCSNVGASDVGISFQLESLPVAGKACV